MLAASSLMSILFFLIIESSLFSHTHGHSAYRIDFPAFLAARLGRVTKSWLMRCVMHISAAFKHCRWLPTVPSASFCFLHLAAWNVDGTTVILTTTLDYKVEGHALMTVTCKDAGMEWSPHASLARCASRRSQAEETHSVAQDTVFSVSVTHSGM